MAARNLIIRIGADSSQFQSQWKKAKAEMGSIGKTAKQAADESSQAFQQIKRAMEQGGKNERIIFVREQIRQLEAENKAAEAMGFGYGDEVYENNIRLLREYKAELADYIREVQKANEAPEEEPVQEQLTLWQRIRATVASIGKRNGHISNIGKEARAATPDIGRLVNSIRRIGVVSLGLRIAGSLMGRLRSIVSSYVAENAALQAQVNGLKSAMGEALAPAINLVVSALSSAMPYVVGFANAVGSLLAALFGKGWTAAAKGANNVAKATGGAAAAQKELNRQLLSFDTLNRLNAENSSAGGGGGGGSTGMDMAEITAARPAWMQRFTDSFNELFNSDAFKAATIGGKIGMALQNGLNWLNGEAIRFDWSGVGQKLRRNWDQFWNSGWAQELMRSFGVALGSGAKLLAGFMQPEWEGLKQAYKNGGIWAALDFIGGLLYPLTPQGMLETLTKEVFTPMFQGLKESFGLGGQSAGESWLSSFKKQMASASTIKAKVSVLWDSVGSLITKFFGITAIPSLQAQWFARGGIMDGAQYFGRSGNTLLGGGERGREAILPLDSNTEWMDKIADRLAAKLQTGGGGEETITVPVYLDGEKITNVVVRRMKRSNRAVGKA